MPCPRDTQSYPCQATIGRCSAHPRIEPQQRRPILLPQAEVRVLQKGVERKLRVSLRSPHRLIPVHIQGRPPPYFILGGLVFTQVSREPCSP